MRLTDVSLQNFRSYEKGSFEFGDVSVVGGGNGVGKSNLLEAIYLLATGKSFRADAEYEMVRHGENFAKVTGTDGRDKVEIVIMDGTYEGAKKKYFVNGIAKRMIDFVGTVRAVFFGPADLDIVTGSPAGRRKYLDFVIAQADREYRRCLLSYEKGLRQRNKLLDLIRDMKASRNQLFFWDRLLIKNGEYITECRQKYLEGLAGVRISTDYDKSVISEARIKQYEREEVLAGSTLVGPHRDDFVVKMKGVDVSKYGSRGEQRMAVMWLKIGERDYLVQEDEMPILLLDDIFSELDHKHRGEVIELVEQHVSKKGQVIMTSADEHLVPPIKESKMIRL